MKHNIIKVNFLIILILFFFTPLFSQAQTQVDSDGDGISDYDEINIYFTNPNLVDTDGDGYSDWVELNAGYSPHNRDSVKLEDNDQDGDGLSDKMELRFGTNLINPDTDGDGYTDGEEIKYGYDPLSVERIKLEKRIEISLEEQKLSYFLRGVKLNEFLVSTGKNNSTPRGEFYVSNKVLKAWSPYGLWMPYWLGLGNGKIGIHELPVWPSGYREGEDHLGTPVSHGCIRLGLKGAEEVYAWTDVGTKVNIY